MNKKNVGLLNIVHCDSHGAVLVAYAMERIVRSFGFDAETIDYKYAGRIKEKNLCVKLYKKWLLKIRKEFHLSYIGINFAGVNLKSEMDMQAERFSKFRTEYLNLTQLLTDPRDEVLNSFDAIIVGSDVVWKPEIVSCEDKIIYFLQEAEAQLKISYAASIGTNDENILNDYESDYKNAFDSFDFISVRESSSIPYISHFTNKLIIDVIDPVFLLEEEEYIKIENDGGYLNSNNTKYLYLYLIGDNKKAIEIANKIAAENNLVILVDFSFGFKNINLVNEPVVSAISAGPSEFIYNIRRAEYVITDSFHAMAFSIFFKKNFMVFKRGSISIRMTDLLKKFELESRLFNGEIPSGSIEWEKIENIIKFEKKKGLNFIEKSMVSLYE